MRSYPLGLNRSCIMILRMLQSFLCLAPAYLLGLNMWGLDPKISLPPFGNTAVGLWMILCISISGFPNMMSCLFWYTYNAGSEGAILVFPILALDIALFFVPLVGLSMLGNREWLGQSCTGYAAWTVEGHNDTLSPQWRPRDPPQWIDLMGSAYRTKPLTGPHMECEQLKIAWSMASFNMTFAFFMLLLRMAEILSMEDSLHRRYLLWTDPNKIPSLFRRIMYVLLVLYPAACSIKRENHRHENRPESISCRPFFQEFFKFRWLPLPRREKSCLDSEQDPSNPMGLLDPGRPASDASLSSFNSLFDLYLLPLNPYPRPRLEGILSIYPILSALTLHLHSTDFRALQQTSNTIKAAIRRSVGRDTSTLAKLTCSHTGRHADLFKRARCVLCDENLCRLVDRVNPVNFILPTAKRLLDQCCGTYIANFEAHAHCVRICTICFVWRKVVNWDNADLDKAPCQCPGLGNVWVCADRGACEKRLRRYCATGDTCAECYGRFWDEFRWRSWWWIHKGAPGHGVCGKDCFDGPHHPFT